MSPVAGTLEAGQTFGRFHIVRLLGEGGMGAVYEAVHTGLKNRVAIKTLLPSIAQGADARTRFLREGEAASRMRHPNVVDVTDVDTEAGIPYLVMEYLEGETLADFITRQGPLDLPLSVDLLLPCISAVSAGHDQGVIHRDLKPQNIFLARGPWREPVPKILDFGVSKIIDGQGPELTGTLAILGTASYMSPEQARGAKVVDAASDQYAMGLILFEMLTATRAHDGEHPLEVFHRIASGVVPDVRALRSDLPPAVVNLLARMLAVNPRDRHPSLRAVARALLPFANEKARVTYADAFVEPDGPTPPPEGAASLTGPFHARPGSGAKSGGTRLLPDSGLAQQKPSPKSASSNKPVKVARARGPLLLVGAGVVVAGAVVLLLTSRGASDARTKIEPADTTEPAASSLAPPAAAELPHVPPSPPPAASPPAVPPPPTAATALAPGADARAVQSPHRHTPAHGKNKKGASPSRTPRRGDNGAAIID
jgi:serine/threonine protein kinase